MIGEAQAPSVEKIEDGVLDTTRFRHPAFGMVALTRTLNSQVELFGSPLKHRTAINFIIDTAYLDRRLNGDWYHTDKHVLQFSMSEAQFAQMVGSVGGEATPITFQVIPSAPGIEYCPPIAMPEMMVETFHRELKEKLQESLSGAKEITDALAALVENGKAGKGQLQEVLALAKALSEGLPNNLAFLQKQVEESMQGAANAAKAEVQGHVSQVISRLGTDRLRETIEASAPLLPFGDEGQVIDQKD